MKIAISCYSGMPQFPALIVLNYYNRMKSEGKFFVYKWAGNDTYQRISQEDYMKGGIFHHLDFVCLFDIGEIFDECGDMEKPEFYIRNWRESKTFIEVIENLPEDFLHHYLIKEIPKGERYFYDPYTGSFRLESEIEWHTAD